MKFNFPDPVWTKHGDGWKLTTPFTNTRYEPYGDGDWWIPHNDGSGNGYVRGKQEGFDTEDKLRAHLYEQACQGLRNTYERAESTIRSLGEAYGDQTLANRAWELTQAVEQFQIDFVQDMAFRDLDETTPQFIVARDVTTAFKRMDAARKLLKTLEDKGS